MAVAGGRLIYATCSLQHEEGEAVVADVTGAMKGTLAIDPVSTAEAGSFAPALTVTGAFASCHPTSPTSVVLMDFS